MMCVLHTVILHGMCVFASPHCIPAQEVGHTWGLVPVSQSVKFSHKFISNFEVDDLPKLFFDIFKAPELQFLLKSFGYSPVLYKHILLIL